jgi:Methylamine utilisation protein MauE
VDRLRQSSWLRKTVTLGVPGVEGTAVATLVIAPDVGFWLATALLLALTLGAYLAWRRSGEVDCGCFGAIGTSKLGPRLLFRNVVLACVAVLAAYVGNGPNGIGRGSVFLAAAVLVGGMTLLLVMEARRAGLLGGLPTERSS